MVGYIVRRLLQMVPVLIGVTLIVFILLRVSGDPVSLMLGEEATPEQVAQLRQAYGLDKPVIEQYLIYMRDLIGGDFGMSLRYNGQPAIDVVLERLPATASLAGMALLIAVLTRLLRSSLIEVLNQDYVRTARAKGIRPRAVLLRHAMRNALLSYLTVIGIEAASLMAGAVVTEQVFAWPGIGLLAIQAINSRDMAVVQAIVILAAVIVMVTNLIVDVLYSVIDPRIQHG